jgi:hypothetical protein
MQEHNNSSFENDEFGSFMDDTELLWISFSLFAE